MKWRWTGFRALVVSFTVGCGGNVGPAGTVNSGGSGGTTSTTGGFTTGGATSTTGGTTTGGSMTGGSSGNTQAGNVELFSWWTAGGEAEALNSVIALHQQKYPRVTVTNAAVALGADARSILQSRMENADPPDLFQANIGVDLLQWSTPPRIESLNPIAQANGLAFYPELIKSGNLSGADGSLYGAPVDIHRINSLFINLSILRRNGVDPASLTTLDGLHAALAKLSTDTQLIAPMNIGCAYQWTLDILILETILPAVAGGQAFEDYFRGTRSPNDPMITAMLDEAATLWRYMPTGVDAPTQVDWVPAIDQFMAGNVAMTVMGDWAKGLIDADGRLKAGVDYDEISFPSATGVTGTFVYTADSFALPIGAPNRDLAIGFLQTVMSDEGQVAFNTVKGSIPPRSLSSTALSAFDPVTQNTIRAFESAADRRVALSGYVPGTFYQPIVQALFDFAYSCDLGTCDPSPVVTALIDNYGALGQ